jgi:hypothetical protein
MNVEIVNLGTDQNPQNINLGLGCSSSERIAFIDLIKKYKDVFAWSYSDLKTFDTSIIQHTIPMLSEEKLVQQKLRKIHPNLESQIINELNKLLKDKIIFPVRHSKWVSNLVPVRKKNGDIRICIDFRNLNRASEKDNFPLPPMEQILQSVSGSKGQTQGSTLTVHQQTLTTGPFGNTCEADEVSPEVAIGGLQDTGVYNQRKCKVIPEQQCNIT